MIKKIVFIIVSITMILSGVRVGLASYSNPGVVLKIQVNPPSATPGILDGQTLDLYKVFDATVSGSPAINSYSYALNSAFTGLLAWLDAAPQAANLDNPPFAHKGAYNGTNGFNLLLTDLRVINPGGPNDSPLNPVSASGEELFRPV